jgi:hypothetical protein
VHVDNTSIVVPVSDKLFDVKPLIGEMTNVAACSTLPICGDKVVYTNNIYVDHVSMHIERHG